jgi:hypothetical protein
MGNFERATRAQALTQALQNSRRALLESSSVGLVGSALENPDDPCHGARSESGDPLSIALARLL